MRFWLDSAAYPVYRYRSTKKERAADRAKSDDALPPQQGSELSQE
jgi:hypothetical protein